MPSDEKIVFDFSGTQTDRSDIDLKFDGSSLFVVVDDQNSKSGHISLHFSWVCHFLFESVVSIISLPDISYEKLIVQDAEDFLGDRSELFGRFLDHRIRKFSVFFTDIGSITVYAREVSISA